MSVKNYQFWIFYAAAWLIYAACLGAVFVGVGKRFDFDLLLTISCNVAPAALLGLLVFQICQRLKWSTRASAIHLDTHYQFASVCSFVVLFNVALLVAAVFYSARRMEFCPMGLFRNLVAAF